MNRRLSLLVLFTSIFAVGVLIWYFFFVTPKSAPSLSGTSLPFPAFKLPAGFGFIQRNLDNSPNSTTTTEITPQGEQPLLEVWNKPTTGNSFTTLSVLKEIDATTTLSKGTSTAINIKKFVHATTTTLMFVDRTTGYVYGHNVETGLTHQISNTTIPGIYDAYIFNNGKKILLRYLDNDRRTIISTLANIPNVLEGGEAVSLENMLNLPKNISSVAISASTNKISYVVPSDNGSYIYTIDAKGQKLTTTSPFGEWSLSYGGEQLYATSKASAYVEGETVLLPSFVRLIGNKTGLISNPSPDGTIISSMLSGTGLASFIFSNRGETLPISLKTLASKCSWGKATFLICAVPQTIPRVTEGLPDDWYQGRVQFADNLSFVNVKSGETYPLYSFDTNLGDMDVTHLKISLDDVLVSYIRKQDASLWLLKTNLLAGE